MHVGRRYQFPVLLAIGSECHTAMEEHLQVGPHLGQVVLASNLQHTVHHGEHPRGHTAEVGNVLLNSLVGNAVALQFEIRQQCSFLLGHTHQVHQRVDVLNKYGTEVAHQRLPDIVIGCMAATQYQCLAIEDTALGIIAQIPCHGIPATGIVGILETVLADGDELALVVGGSTGFCIPAHLAGPKHICLALAHAVDEMLQILVGIDGRGVGKLLVCTYFCKVVLPAPLRCFRLLQQSAQYLHLQAFCLGLISVKLPSSQ